MTFKGIYHTLKVQNECIRDIEQILPAKANINDIRAEIHQQLQLKANLNDMKKTMAEVAANIESRTTFHDVKRLVEQKVERSDVQYMVQPKVSFDEMKSYVEQVNSVRYNPLQEELEQEIRKLKRRLDETVSQMQNLQTLNQQAKPGMQTSDISRLEQHLDKRLADFEEQVNDKASKQSVAQALHRKLNKQEFDETLAKKADLQDIQRVF